ncbi:serine hydrolase [Lysinibacillus sp. M3]|uniref:Serine hydrolase n=1 Tax=Lysinibacillus zambalensis TaxID=3160866 RepID=A0ABV1MXL6_9BACI
MIDYPFLQNRLKKEKINTFLINSHGKTIFRYYKNKKQQQKLHKINSCTKGILSILFGIAIDRKYLASVHIPVHSFFPELFERQDDKRKMDMTIYHLLTMTEGLDFPEFGEWNCFAPMVFHSDIVKFIINRPMVHPVGTHMNYNSGCSHILSAILQQVTSMKTKEFANRYLFQPLGIQEYQWYEDKKKISKGADGLLLKAEDMMKVGLLVLKKGVYNEKRIVSEDWINHSIKPNLMTYEKIGYYGMHWWVNKQNETKAFSEDNHYFFALGFGGQYIFIWPKEELVITITGDLYETSLLPLQLIKDHILR